MYIQDLYAIYDKGYSLSMDGDKEAFNIEHVEKKIKGIWSIKKESRSS